MERKFIDVFLPYNDKGTQAQKCFRIGFISNRMDREYREFVADVTEIRQLAGAYEGTQEKIYELMRDWKGSRKERTEKMAVLKKDLEKVEAQLQSKLTGDMFARKTKLMISILDANGVEDEQALSPEFWDEQVEASDFEECLRKCITKDYVGQKKKKGLNTMKMG